MKTLITRNGILFLLLMAGLIFNILWSARLESTAQDINAKVIEHHGMLSKNRDVLSALDGFIRSVAGTAGINNIMIDKNGVDIMAGSNSIKVKGDSISVDSGGNMRINVSSKQDFIEIVKGSSLILIGKGPFYKEGVTIASLKMGTIAVSERGIAMKTDSLPIDISVGSGDKNLGFSMNPKSELIEVKRNQSVMRVGKGSIGEGIELGEFSTGTIAVTKGEGVGIKGKESLKINSEGDINISSKGNINIRSEKGNVKINGKRIDLNE